MTKYLLFNFQNWTFGLWTFGLFPIIFGKEGENRENGNYIYYYSYYYIYYNIYNNMLFLYYF